MTEHKVEKYAAPVVNVVQVSVECGFAVSGALENPESGNEHPWY